MKAKYYLNDEEVSKDKFEDFYNNNALIFTYLKIRKNETIIKGTDKYINTMFEVVIEEGTDEKFESALQGKDEERNGA